MTNTLTKIADLKEELKRKEELATLTLNNWLKEHDPVKELGSWCALKDVLFAYKKILKKIVKLELTLKLSLVEEGGTE